MNAAVLLFLLGSARAPGLETQVRAEFAKQKYPGLVVYAEQKGKPMLALALGYANLEHKVPMKMDSFHELASVSKQFTAVAILKLMEKGKLRLEDSITRYIDGAPEIWKPITIRNLLEHTSGLADYIADPQVIRRDLTTAQMLQTVFNKPLDFEPGTKWEYSNTGYMALGHIVAKVSSTSLWQFTYDQILKPNGISGVMSNDPSAIIPNRADGYDKTLNRLIREDFTSRSFSLTADGHIMASAKGLAQWSRALQLRKILKPESWKLAWTPSAESVKANPGYGFGFGVKQENNQLTLNHTGGWMGTSTLLVTGIDQQTTLIVMINQSGANPTIIGKLVADNLFKSTK